VTLQQKFTELCIVEAEMSLVFDLQSSCYVSCDDLTWLAVKLSQHQLIIVMSEQVNLAKVNSS